MSSFKETPDTVHGRLLESAHYLGYSAERACQELLWLLEDERWQKISGIEDASAFIKTIDFSDFKLAIEDRKKIAKKLTDLGATQRESAKALGTTEATINRDLNNKPVTSVTKQENKSLQNKEIRNGPVTNVTSNQEQSVFNTPPEKIASAPIEKAQKTAEKEIKSAEQAELRKSALSEEGDFKPTVYTGRFQDVCKDFSDESIDHIITDPPYPLEYINEWKDLSQVASRILKPGGFCVCYSGTYNIPKVFEAMTAHLEYYWTLVLLHTGGNQFIHPRNLNTAWKPIFVFQKPPIRKTEAAIFDVIKGTGKEKYGHVWQQAEEELIYIIEGFTVPGETVLDPFAGSGTTGIACKAAKRKSILIEVNSE